MDTSALKKFAPEARRKLIKLVTSQMSQVLSMDSVEIREKEEAVNKLNELIQRTSKEAVIDRVAYIWFNRFCALRFMDVNRYTNIGTVSPVEGYSQPEILQEAKQGHIDEDLDRFVDKQKVYDLLSGKIPSSDPQQEAYRLLLVGICNNYHTLMPFMFQHIEDYTELLMPEDLLSQNSILQAVRDALKEDNCKNVEIIGWLYQFYISEKKDEVFNGLKKNIKITPENIPAATQLFTPHWIVKYLVENSLGRLWMLNRPNSRLVDQMDYYIKPDQEEKDYLRINSPEELKVCDIACGSGHMLIYGFDVLYFIYEEEGYDASEIPRLILENNLYGIEIDERAGELAAFCLFMKAREKYKGFFRKPVQPNICVLENIEFTNDEVEHYMDKIGRDIFTGPLLKTLNQFNEVDNFGSLIRPELKDVDHIKRVIEEKDMGGQLLYHKTHEKVLKVLKQTDFLRPKYHVLVTNPPYMGGKGMNLRLKAFAKENFLDSKSDLFAMFIERNLELSLKHGCVAMITMQSWMFLSSFESLRNNILNECTILSMTHLGARAFDSIGGEVVSTTSFVIELAKHEDLKGSYLRLIDGANETEKKQMLRENLPTDNYLKPPLFFRVSTLEFKKIPGSPIAYWLSQEALQSFNCKLLQDFATFRAGLQTGDNDLFLRYWHEVNRRLFVPNCESRQEAILSKGKWFPHNKGGGFRKWHGNKEYLINWGNDGFDIKDKKRNDLEKGKITANNSKCWNQDFYFKPGLTWSSLSSAEFSLRDNGFGFLFDTKGQMLFVEETSLKNQLLAFLNSNVAKYYLSALSPTLDFNGGVVSKLPLQSMDDFSFQYVLSLIKNAKNDWDSYEMSWDFSELALIKLQKKESNIHFECLMPTVYSKLRQKWQEIILNVHRLEEDNNRIFIETYNLENDLTPDVPLEEITLTCNPHYRYKGNKTEEELETLLLADTMKELISYSVGCMFGRYSLDKPGLILANQGETIDDYIKQIPTPTFMPDEDNVIPILDSDWFIDGITDSFKHFLRVTFGEEHYEENLKFLEQAIGKDIRKYFLKDFYNHHVKMYKKRPIYWMFSSPKGSFNALIYMHRYKPDTVSIVLNNYLREFRTKISAKKDNLEEISSSSSSSQKDKTKAIKEIEKLKKIITELEDYERDILYPLATQQVEIDLDDGVKVNYNKFGKALKKIPGLTGK